MSRSVGWHDSAELALVAAQMGASHAPGSPLHSLLGHVIALFTTQAYLGTTLLSVVAMALAAGLQCRAVTLA